MGVVEMLSAEKLDVIDPSIDQVAKRLLGKSGADWELKSNLVGINTTSKDVQIYNIENNCDFMGTSALLGRTEELRSGACANQWLVVRIPKSLLFVLTADRI